MLQISLEFIILLIFMFLCFVMMIFIYLHVKDLHVKIEAQKELNLANKDDIKDFLYEKLSQNSKDIHGQIEKNAQIFLKISLMLEKLQTNINLLLNEKLNQIGDKLTNSLKEQQKESSKDFENLSKKVDERLESINQKVEDRLKVGFENIDKTFKEIIVGIAKINQAQKNIESLSTEVTSLQGILTDKKTRGIFGEVQLNSILKSIFGDKKELYEVQYTLSNKTICDAIIKAPEPVGILAIDSKFPLENYRRMSEDKAYVGDFRANLKKHINDISSKYIINSETSNMAIMFLPAEAIFAEIYAYHESIIDYAREKSVWIASPTTFMALLTTILAVVRDIKTKEQAKKIQEELFKLSKNFKLYRDRWANLAKHIDQVSKDVKDISTTAVKISTEFDRIEKVEFNDENDNDKVVKLL
ncbi:MAG: DNA recombination protein RmuC [Campylobacteraceae bacterium]